MVRTINVTFNDQVFEELHRKKIKAGMKKKTSYSWEEFFMVLAKIK
jgi:hypothetical protein